MADFALKYDVRDYFTLFHHRNERFACIVAHRRAGKTVACVYELVIRALYTNKTNARYAYIAPYYRQAKDVAWTYLKEATKGIATEVRESELRVKLPNGAWITLYGADNPDALRGIYLDGVIIDEIADTKPSLMGEIILPTLIDRKGWLVVIGTVKGKNHFYNMHMKAANDPSWFSLLLKPDDTKILDEEDLRELRAQMTPEEYAQEMLCDFTAAVKGTYYADLIQKLEKQNANRKDTYDPTQPVQVTADLGYTDSTAFVFWQEIAGEIRIIDCYSNQGQPLSHYIEKLKEKGYEYETLWLPHDARAKTLQTGRSTIEQLVEAGFPCRIVPSLKVQQGIDAARLILPNCYFDEKANDLLEALRAYKRDWNDTAKVFRDKPLHDWSSDFADAFRYFSLVACQRKHSKTYTEKPKQLKAPEYRLTDLFEDNEKSGTLSLVKMRM